MPSWGSFSYAFGPFVAFAVMAVLIVLLRWAFGRGQSLIASPASPGNPDEYGLLKPVATPSNYIEGEVMRKTLEAAGVRANLAQTNLGPRVMVWPADENRAKEILRRGPR